MPCRFDRTISRWMDTSLNDQPTEITCRICLKSTSEEVFSLLTTDDGRSLFWAERTVQEGNAIVFRFPNGDTLQSRVLETRPPRRFSLTYFNDSIVTFDLRDGTAGTDLRVQETELAVADVAENRAGWVSVLLNLKAQADHGIDLRNHDPERTWAQGYVDN